MTLDPGQADAVEAVVRDCIDGWHAGDEQRMDRSLHDDLVKQTVDENGGFMRVSKARMDHLHLVRVEGTWRILHDLFRHRS